LRNSQTNAAPGDELYLVSCRPIEVETGSKKEFGAPGVQRFIFELDGLPPGTSADGAMLTFTAVSPNDAIEVNASLN
jgi:hypothetical protein